MAENDSPAGGIQTFMQKKVAGIPVMWLALGIAVIAVYGALQLKATPDTPDETTDETGSDVEGDQDIDTSQPVFQATPVITQPSGVSVAATPQQDTNELWGRRAIEWLTANGFTLQVASNAIDKYLNGQNLSYNEGQARDKAVGQFGLPPEGILPTTTSAAPVTPATTQGQPPLTHTVKNSRDNTSKELARIYYGLTNTAAVNLIDAANVGKPQPYPVGSKVRIPAWREPKFYRATAATRTLSAIARKNDTTSPKVQELNPRTHFPVKAGTRVRVR